MTPRLLVLGSTNVDLVAHVERHPAPGETLLGTGGERTAGGKGANQALAAALQGAAVSFVGAVGEDDDAPVALASLRASGADLSGVRTDSQARTGLAIITLGADGENTIVVIPGANARVSPRQAHEAVESLAADDILLMQGELSRETTEQAIKAASARGIRTIFNVAPWSRFSPDVLAAADPLVLNEHEAALAAAELGIDTATDPVELAAQLLEAGMRSVVITLGAAGAVVAEPGAAPRTIPSPRVLAVDTTGAGDAFAGALAARLLSDDSLADSAEHAVRVGAYAVQHFGAQSSYPDRDAHLP